MYADKENICINTNCLTFSLSVNELTIRVNG